MGSYDRALAGAVEVFSNDGRVFSATNIEVPGSVHLKLDRVEIAQTNDHYYLTGKMSSRLVSAQDSGQFLDIDAQINTALQ